MDTFLSNLRQITHTKRLSVETKLSAMALSRALPVLPIDGVMPISLSLSEKESAVYWTPWSE